MSILLLLATYTIQASASGSIEANKRSHRPQVSLRQCGLSTTFNLLADSGGIWLYRYSDSPREIFFHDGSLSVDHKTQLVSANDAQRLKSIERKIRELMPQVADIAREVININYDAFGGVIEVLTGSDLNERKIEHMRKRANDYVDSTLGRGRWDQSDFSGNFEKYIESDAKEFKGSIARNLLWQIFTGRSKAMDQRARGLGNEFDIQLDARRNAVESKANALCPQVMALLKLQDEIEFRYEGQQLQMLTSIKDLR